MKKISKFFSEKEFECHCGCKGLIIDKDLLIMAESFRAYLNGKFRKNVTINVHCVYRCEKHNKKVGGMSKSKHLAGQAMDLHCPELTTQELFFAALECHNKRGILWGGLGMYYVWKTQGIHIDTGNYRNWIEK